MSAGRLERKGAFSHPFFVSGVLVALMALLGACAAAGPPARDDSREVRIVRDDYGVPHIYSDSVYGLFYGYGYAVAEDRLFQMTMARRSTQGEVAEVLGADYADFDQRVREHFDPALIRRQIGALGRDDRAILAGYAAGMNARIAEVREAPATLLPKEFTEFGVPLRDWDLYDVAMIFVGTIANRYADFNTELDNAAIVAMLAERHGEDDALAIFDSLNPRFTDNAPTTISATDHAAALERRETLAPPLLAGLPRPQPQTMAGFSNCWVLGPARLSGADAVLVNGPQFGWFNPGYVYSVGLHGAGFDVAGNTPFGYPGLLFGHNARIGWGSTWGAGDVVDVVTEELHPADATRYRAGDEWLAFKTRTETIRIRGEADRVIDVSWSRNGPIVARDEERGLAWAKRRSWTGHELAALFAWVHSMRAGNYAEWIAIAATQPLNINWYYADVDGNIGYAFTGRYPERDPAHDNRLPVAGDSPLLWSARRPFAANPQALNPEKGYIANWNNKPAPGVPNPDEYWYSWSEADRIDYLHEAIEAQPALTPDAAWGLIETSSYADVNAPYFIGRLLDAAAGDADLAAAANVLANWDRYSRDRDADGYYDEAATALFRPLLANLLEAALEDDLGPAFEYFRSTGYPTVDVPTGAGLNIQTGTKALVEALAGRTRWDFLNGEEPAAFLRRVLAATLRELEARNGSDIREWRLPVAPRPFHAKNFLGVPQTSERNSLATPIEQNRGTENNLFVMANGRITGYEVTPPGQSGFIAPDGTRSEHYDDQLAMYHEFGRKRIWFYADDVERAKRREVVLTVN